MKTYVVIPGETRVQAETWMVNDDGSLQFFDESDELITMWARDRWHRVTVEPEPVTE